MSGAVNRKWSPDRGEEGKLDGGPARSYVDPGFRLPRRNVPLRQGKDPGARGARERSRYVHSSRSNRIRVYLLYHRAEKISRPFGDFLRRRKYQLMSGFVPRCGTFERIFSPVSRETG